MLIAKTHFTNVKSFQHNKVQSVPYRPYRWEVHGRTAIVICDSIEYYMLEGYKTAFQATATELHGHFGSLNILTMYCLPRHNIKSGQYEYLLYLGNRFLICGNWNAKNNQWGSRLTIVKGKECCATICRNNIHHLTTGQPTDKRKISDIRQTFASLKTSI